MRERVEHSRTEVGWFTASWAYQCPIPRKELSTGNDPVIQVYETCGLPTNLTKQMLSNLAELYCVGLAAPYVRCPECLGHNLRSLVTQQVLSDGFEPPVSRVSDGRDNQFRQPRKSAL